MYEWANNVHEQADMCVEVQGTLAGVDDALMTRVLKLRGWHLIPDSSYPSLEAYIGSSHAALAADVRAYHPPPTRRPHTASAGVRR